MELIVYDNRINRRRTDESDKPLFRVSDLKIVLMARLIELLDVKEGDGVSFFQSPANEHDWYIAKDPNGLPLTNAQTGSGKNRLEIANRKLARIFADLYGKSCILEVARGKIEHDGLQLRLIITAPIVAERRLANLTKPKGNG